MKVIKKSLNIKQNIYLGDEENVRYGRVLAFDDMQIKDDGCYWLDNGDNISIIKIKDKKVTYELGRIYTGL